MLPYVLQLLALLLTHLEETAAYSAPSQTLVAIEVDALADSGRDQRVGRNNKNQKRTKMMRMEEKQSDKVQRLRPAPYDTTEPTCDGTPLSNCSSSGDPCATLSVDACSGIFHACGGGDFKRCTKGNDNASCVTGSRCYLPCQGVFREESKVGAANPDCTDLANDACQDSYILSASAANPFMGYQCRLEDEDKCIRDAPCAVQNPAVSLGEKLCNAPSVEFSPGGKSCKDATKFRPNQTCVAQCEEGYKPSTENLECQSDGTLSPETFSCIPQPCQAPDQVPNAASEGECTEGTSIESGKACTPRCKENYLPSETELKCAATRLYPSTFKCLAPCTPPTVQFAPGDGNSCEGGGPVKHGEKCKANCQAGFSPSVNELLCQDGTLVVDEGSTEAASFTCGSTFCNAPEVDNGDGCEEAQLVAGQQCTAKCQKNYVPSKAKITCDPSVLQGPDFKLPGDSFRCLAPCTLPKVQNAKTGGACYPSGTLPHGSQCTAMQCEHGYLFAGGPLSCTDGLLTPTGTVSCTAVDCSPPEVLDGEGCEGKTSIKMGESCRAKCKANFVPSVQEVTCDPTQLAAPTYKMPNNSFKCQAPCVIPQVQNAQDSVACSPGSNVLHGTNCQPQCNPGYRGDGDGFSCNDGAVAGSFSCQADECRPPDVQLGEGCKDKTVLKSGEKCVAQCSSDYVPSVGEITCDPTTLTGPDFKLPSNSWTCLPSCTVPQADFAAKGDCSPGSKIKHGQGCKPQCLPGWENKGGQLSCNAGTLNPNSFSCELVVPAKKESFYNCWHGDSHFTCAQGKRTDPLIQGNHWVLQQECPGSPHWMWVQGLFGPYKPSMTMGTAFGGAFMLGNVVTIRVVADNSEKWEVKYNNRRVQEVWQKIAGRNKYKHTLAPGLKLRVRFSGEKVVFKAGYGLKYKGHRRKQHRTLGKAFETENLEWQHRYSSNRMRVDICKDGNVNGQMWDIHDGYNPKLDTKNYVPDAVSLWKKNTKDKIASALDKPTAAGQNTKATWQMSLLALHNRSAATLAELGAAQQDRVMTACVGQQLQVAHEKCDDCAHAAGIDEEDKAEHETFLKTCLYDACAIQEGGDQPESIHDESLQEEAVDDNEHHLHHREVFSTVAAGTDCTTDKPVKVDASFRARLSPDEDASLPACSKVAAVGNPCDACARIASDSRMYMVGNEGPRQPESDLCGEHRLAMPKDAAKQAELYQVQKNLSDTDQAWLGGKYDKGKWVWGDGSDVTNAPTNGQQDNWLCMDLESGAMVVCCDSEDGGDCQPTADMAFDALCETQFKG